MWKGCGVVKKANCKLKFDAKIAALFFRIVFSKKRIFCWVKSERVNFESSKLVGRVLCLFRILYEINYLSFIIFTTLIVLFMLRIVSFARSMLQCGLPPSLLFHNFLTFCIHFYFSPLSSFLNKSFLIQNSWTQLNPEC